MALNSWSVPGSLSVDQDLIVGKRLVIANAPVVGQVNADWSSTTGLSQILNKPALKIVWQDLTLSSTFSGSVQFGLDASGFVQLRGSIFPQTQLPVGSSASIAQMPAAFTNTGKGVTMIGGAYQANSPYQYFSCIITINQNSTYLNTYPMSAAIPTGTNLSLDGFRYYM